MTSQIAEMTPSSIFFDIVLFLLLSLLTGPSFMSMLWLVTGSGFMTFFFYKGSTKNLVIRNTPVWVLPNIWRLGQVMDAKFGTNVSNRCYWMLQNSRVTACIVFVLLRENQLGGGEKITHPTQIRVNPTSIHGFMFFVSMLEIWRKFSFWVNSEWWISWLIYIR